MTEPRTISVHGEAQIEVAPDEASIALGIETVKPDLASANRENDDAMKRVLAAAKGHGVADAQLSTDQVSIELLYEWHENRRQLVGYAVRRSLVIVVRNLETLDVVLTACITAGANFVHGVRFTTRKLREHRDQARTLAVKAAREKAIAMASELGQHVGVPRSIAEGHQGWSGYSPYGWSSGQDRFAMGSQNVMQAMPGGGEGEAAPSPGTVSVKATVDIVFELVTPA